MSHQRLLHICSTGLFSFGCFFLSSAVQAQEQVSPPVSLTANAPMPTTISAPPIKLENSVVKIFSTIRAPDTQRPWNKTAPREVSGSGVVIEGNRILTNAHVVDYASQVQIQGKQGGDKISAKVVAIARGIDLAVLQLDDASFFNTHAPIARADKLPEIKDTVFAYGYPLGGTSLSTTKGIVSRIEFTPYHQNVSGLRIQIDAAINPGNSGGPVIAGDKMIGLAFSHALNTQNIGYIIPNEEIELFLQDIADGHYDGKPFMMENLQLLENPALRRFLKIDKSVEGMIIRKSSQPTLSLLKEWDIVTHIGDYPVDNQGMVKLNGDLRVNFRYHVQQLAHNGKLPLTIVRAGKSMNVEITVSAKHPTLVPYLDGAYPSYFIYGPIVFSHASIQFLSYMISSAPTMLGYAFNESPLLTRIGALPDATREELVIICSPFFPHKLVSGYSNHQLGTVVYSINDKPVRSLRHLVTLLRDLKDDFVVIKTDQKDGPNIVLPRNEMMEATEAILTDNGIRSQGSADMMEIWQAKSTH